VDNEEVKIIQKGTKEMNANILTKSLQGAHFVYERMPDRMDSASRRQDSRLILRENNALRGQSSSIDMESSLVVLVL
jgi:uncharacterized protein (DUF2235 family)